MANFEYNNATHSVLRVSSTEQFNVLEGKKKEPAAAFLRASLLFTSGGVVESKQENDYNIGTNPLKVKERLIHVSQAKKRPPIMKSKPKEQINKKALVWIGSIFSVVVIVMAVLLILDNN
ncbi:hypothetical protein [Paenibacillus sp. CF384]|uniref:hypothetical protein n=1 Tax=Paenibacillus sp. CF384 TaxID=1884382 RepID=UPI00115FBC78|nr:hypothetical protein [Paenibacillus sp. CF384]